MNRSIIETSTISSNNLQGSLTSENSTSPSTSRYLLIIQSLSIYALVLIIVGTVGNFLTVVTLLRRNLRRLSTIRYLIAVSICDTLSLYGWNLNNFYKFTISQHHDNLEEISLVHCRLLSFMTFVSLQLSSWCLTAVSVGKHSNNSSMLLLILFYEFSVVEQLENLLEQRNINRRRKNTDKNRDKKMHLFFLNPEIFFDQRLDRALTIYWPNWKQSYGRLKYTKYYIGLLTSICIILNSHVLVLNGYRTTNGDIKCYSARHNPDYMYPQWERIHLVVYNLCPFALMCISNTYIIVVTVRSSRVQIDSTPSTTNQRKQIERYRQLTALLIILTFAFVLLTLPSCIYYVFFRQHFENKTERTYRYMIQISLNSIQFTSHAINFFLYCFSAKSFLNELRDMFRDLLSFCRRKQSARPMAPIRWSKSPIRSTRPNRYLDSPFDQTPTDPRNILREMRQYKFETYPEFQTGSGQRGTWS